MYYSYDYGYGGLDNLFHMSAGGVFFSLLLAALMFASLWIIFQKAGEEGWAAIVPLYNAYKLFKITWGNGWMFLLMLIPIANIVIGIITYVKLAKAFGKGGGWACGLIFLPYIFMPITAFSKEIQYVGVPGKDGQYNAGYAQGGYQQPGYQNPYSQGYQAPNQGYQQPNYQAPPQQDTYQQQSAQNSNYYYQQTEQTGAKYCSSCGTQIEGNIKYCPKCGKPQ